jgi:N-dimethylarginine dimethylaminohydrolase
MHLMGTLRLAGPDTAIGYPGRTPHGAIRALRERGYHVLWAPDMEEIGRLALNFVPLGPNRILMAADCPRTQAMYQNAGIECITVAISELGKAAGGMGCLTGILKREQGEAVQ